MRDAPMRSGKRPPQPGIGPMCRGGIGAARNSARVRESASNRLVSRWIRLIFGLRPKRPRDTGAHGAKAEHAEVKMHGTVQSASIRPVFGRVRQAFEGSGRARKGGNA